MKKYMLVAGGVLLGALAGYIYYHFVGCSSGSCSITSDPMGSTLYGAMMGGVIGNLFRAPKKDNNN